MKKQFLLLACSCVCVAACKKGDSSFGGDKRLNTKPTARKLTSTDNAELDRICEDATDWTYHFGITTSTNYGRASLTPAEDAYFSGTSPNTLKLWMNGTLYEPYPDGQWLRQGNEYREWFGKTVFLRLEDGAYQSVRTVYVPTELRAQRTGVDPNNAIPFAVPRTGNSFSWAPDPQNKMGRIAVHYVFDIDPQSGNSNSTVVEDILVVPDDGRLDLDPFIPANATGMRVEFIRGTSSSVMAQDGKKTLFSIFSDDYHKYNFSD